MLSKTSTAQTHDLSKANNSSGQNLGVEMLRISPKKNGPCGYIAYTKEIREEILRG
jgi:hypothetical protein